VAGTPEFRCFESTGRKSPIQLQFDFSEEGKEAGSVTYRKGAGSIPVERISDTTIEAGPEGRPDMVRVVWQERSPQGKGGRYLMDSQGAVVYRMEYLRKDGKSFAFKEVDEVHGDEACEWR
jgi:hypothetical protein